MIRWGHSIRGLAGAKRAGLALATGALMALSLPPLGFWPVLFVALPLFLLLLEGAAGQAPLKAFLLGWLFGFGYFLAALHWIAQAFLIDAETYLWMMPFMVGGLAGGMALYWGAAALAAHGLRLSGLRLVLGFAACLAIAEWLRGHLFTGFPWAVPGLAADGMGAVAQLASVTGMTGLTVLILLWSGLGLLLFHRNAPPVKAAAAAILLLLPLSWGYGLLRLSNAPAGVPAGQSVRIVQPNIAQDDKWRQENGRQIFDMLVGLSLQPTAAQPASLATVSHLIWPESAVPFLIDESPVARAELKRMLSGHTILTTGAVRRDATAEDSGPARYFNSIITFDGWGEVAARYDKWRLVPGGEFLPFEWLLDPLGFRKVVTVPGSFAAGPGAVTIRLPDGLRAAMLVCYEVIFPHQLVDGSDRPDVIINVTNDGWFGNSTGPHQHLAQARLRAIEQGLPLLRAANTGISAVIDSNGRIVQALPLLQSGVIDAPLPRPGAMTVYGRAGDWIMAVMVALLLGSAALWRNTVRNS